MAVKKYIILASILTFSVTAKADDVPNTFEAGEPIVASDVNANFVDLQNQINTLKAQLESQNSSDTRREFVGLTPNTTTGDIGGYYSANQMCDEAHSESFMCNSDEIKSLDPSLISGMVWIDPVIINATGNGQQGGFYVYEFGSYSHKHTNCSDWSQNGANDIGTYFYQGQRRFGGCASPKKIACCK